MGGKAKDETIINKINSALKPGKGNRLNVLKNLGGNLPEQIAGFKAKEFLPGGLTAKIDQAGGLAALFHPAAIPGIAGGMLATSPKLMGLVAKTIGTSERQASTIINALSKTTGLSPSQIGLILAQANRASSLSSK